MSEISAIVDGAKYVLVPDDSKDCSTCDLCGKLGVCHYYQKKITDFNGIQPCIALRGVWKKEAVMEDKNALAELADKLSYDARIINGAVGGLGCVGKRIAEDICMAQLIVTEISRVAYNEAGLIYNSPNAVTRSREIAEKGAGNG